MIPEWHQLVPMSGHVRGLETANKNATICNFLVYIRVNWTTQSFFFTICAALHNEWIKSQLCILLQNEGALSIFQQTPLSFLSSVWNTDINTWIAGSHGFAYSSMRATGNTPAAILLQSKHLIDTLTSTHISAWNATGDRFLASNFLKILREKMKKFPQIFETLKYLLM